LPVQLTKSGVRIGDAVQPLLSGTMHYWRIARSLWEECLLKMKGMGFSIVETYIPWSVHEISEGQFDFGRIVPEKDIAAFMLEKGADVNAQSNDGRTALIEAAYRGNTEIVKFLIDKGAQVNVQNSEKWSPLMWAASFGWSETVKLLIDKVQN